MRLIIVLTALICLTIAQPATADTLPPSIEKCFREAVKELMLVNRSDRATVKKLFLKHINRTRLGGRTFGGATWKQAAPKWQDKALDMYFELLYSEGNQLTTGMKNVEATIITPRLADLPDIKLAQGYHVVASVQIDNGNQFGIAVLITERCEAFDFSQGSWASRWLSAAEVDLALHD